MSEGARIGTWLWRQASDSIEASDSLWSVLGVVAPRERVCDRDRFVELFDPSDRARLTGLCRGEVASPGEEIVTRLVGEDGVVRAVRLRTRTIRDLDGDHRGVVGIALDVTDWTDVDREAAHELRNHLMVVLGNLDLVQLASTRGTKLAAYVELALRSAERCAELTEKMLAPQRGEGAR
jgi:PAS domain S-box-containing protein